MLPISASTVLLQVVLGPAGANRTIILPTQRTLKKRSNENCGATSSVFRWEYHHWNQTKTVSSFTLSQTSTIYLGQNITSFSQNVGSSKPIAGTFEMEPAVHLSKLFTSSMENTDGEHLAAGQSTLDFTSYTTVSDVEKTGYVSEESCRNSQRRSRQNKISYFHLVLACFHLNTASSELWSSVPSNAWLFQKRCG